MLIIEKIKTDKGTEKGKTEKGKENTWEILIIVQWLIFSLQQFSAKDYENRAEE